MKNYIPILTSFDFTDPLTEDWKGSGYHIGSVHRNTPINDMLANKTKRATVSMMAGVIIWGATRLEHFTEVDFLLELAEASFVWQFDWRYVDTEAEPNYSPPDEPVEESAVFEIDNFLRNYMDSEINWKNPYAPIDQLFHLQNVVKFILTKEQEKAFKKWLIALNERMNQIAKGEYLSKEEQKEQIKNNYDYIAYANKVRGILIPPLALNPDYDIAGIDIEQEAINYLNSLDYTKNRFLRSSEEMKKLGFNGEPYIFY